MSYSSVGASRRTAIEHRALVIEVLREEVDARVQEHEHARATRAGLERRVPHHRRSSVARGLTRMSGASSTSSPTGVDNLADPRAARPLRTRLP